MKILVFGKTGQVATELSASKDVISMGRQDADLTDADVCAAKIDELQPDAIINAAAYTAVDQAQDEPELAHKVNAIAPGIMAKRAAKLDIPFVHISTDYVFDGSGDSPHKPDDLINPLGVYGRTKAEGEAAIRSAGGCYAILRTSWVFSSHGSNFVKTMLWLGREREQLSVVSDQIGGPTSAGAIAHACLTIAEQLKGDATLSGTYHFSGAPDISWAGFAREIFKAAKMNVDIQDIESAAYPTKATRPANSRLDCSLTQEVFGIERPNWASDLIQILKQLGATGT